MLDIITVLSLRLTIMMKGFMLVLYVEHTKGGPTLNPGISGRD